MPVTLDSIAVSGSYDGSVTLPDGIQAGDLLVALVYYENDPPQPLDGFTEVAHGGIAWEWVIAQYRVADGSESASVAIDPSWAHGAAIVARITGVDPVDPVNAFGTPERTAGSGTTSKSAELDAIAPDADGTSLAVLALYGTASTPDSLTLEGVDFDAFELTPDANYGGGISVEALGASGSTGTRTVEVQRAAGSVYRIAGAMMALNPIPPPPPPPFGGVAVTLGLDPFAVHVDRGA